MSFVADLFQKNFDLQHKNSLAVPSRCSWFTEIHKESDLHEVASFADKEATPLVFLGSGTNVLLAEQLEAVVAQIKIPGKRILEVSGDTAGVEVSAGENWHQFTSWCLRQKLYGLENLALIPGTCGAAPIQNIGAYGVELSDFIEAVKVFDIDTRTFRSLTVPECELQYRDSVFKHALQGKVVIVSMCLTLKTSPTLNLGYPALAEYIESNELDETPENIFKAVCAIRTAKLPDPERIPNVGSFFKNPVVKSEAIITLQMKHPTMPSYPLSDGHCKIPAAWLIEKAGWKGVQKDGVGVHEKQALVLTNAGRAPVSRVLQLANQIQSDVRAMFNVELELEPRRIV
jgi:UDP-N-acetylmuramate dehydrogenase